MKKILITTNIVLLAYNIKAKGLHLKVNITYIPKIEQTFFYHLNKNNIKILG